MPVLLPLAAAVGVGGALGSAAGGRGTVLLLLACPGGEGVRLLIMSLGADKVLVAGQVKAPWPCGLALDARCSGRGAHLVATVWATL